MVSIPTRSDIPRLLYGGLAPATREQSEEPWLQVNLRPARGRSEAAAPSTLPLLYAAIEATIARLTAAGAIDAHFFMHKPPGLRLRVRARRPEEGAAVRDDLVTAASSWQQQGLITSARRGRYEPEVELFGGTRAMAFAHALFTADSAFWLAFHSKSEYAAVRPPVASLAVLGQTFRSREVVGLESIGVFAHIRARGRMLGHRAASLDPGRLQVAARGIRDLFFGTHPRPELGPVASLVDSYAHTLEELRRTHPVDVALESGDDPVAWRRTLAWTTIFHWNRARLPIGEQILLAEALSDYE